MMCGTGLDLLQCSGEFPCDVYHTGVGNNSIYCTFLIICVHYAEGLLIADRRVLLINIIYINFELYGLRISKFGLLILIYLYKFKKMKKIGNQG